LSVCGNSATDSEQAATERAVIEHWRTRWAQMSLVGGPAAPNELRLVEIVERAWRPVQGALVLEVGCGHGNIAVAFAERGATCLCLDSADRAVAHCARRLSDLGHHGWGCGGSAFALPVADGGVDVVVSGGLLEHFEAPLRRTMLAEMRRVSRGCVVALVPNGLDPFYRAAKWRLQETGRWPWGEEHSLRGLTGEFAAAGLRVVEECSFDFHNSVSLFRDAFGLAPEQARALLAWQSHEPTPDASLGYRLVTVGVVD